MPDHRKNASSCTVCRKRKVKCDQQLPCRSCIRHKAPEQCRYKQNAMDGTPALKTHPEGSETAPKDGHQASQNSLSREKRSRDVSDATPGVFCGQKRPETTRLFPINDQPVFLAPNTQIQLLNKFRSVHEVQAVNPVVSADESLGEWSKNPVFTFDPVTLEESHHGMLTWQALIRSDPGLAQIWNFLYEFTPPRPGAGTANVLSVTKSAKKDPSKFQFLDRIRRYQATEIDPQTRERAYRIPLGLTFNDPNPDNVHIDISEELLKILPRRHVTRLHVRRFFRAIYPFFPFLDEPSFRADAARVFQAPELAECTGTQDSDDASMSEYERRFSDDFVEKVDGLSDLGPFSTPHISTPRDLATVGLFCILLRMSYLSLLSNSGESAPASNKPTNGLISGEKSSHGGLFPASGVDGVCPTPTLPNAVIETESDLLHVPIGIEMIDLAQRCLDHYQQHHRYNLHVIQLLVYMRVYQELSPENTDGPSRDVYSLNNALLVQTAQMVGLHRAPSGPHAALRRRLWCFIQYKDVVNALKFGTTWHDVPTDCMLDPGSRDAPSAALLAVERLTAAMRPVARCFGGLDASAGATVAAVNELERSLAEMGTLSELTSRDQIACLCVQYSLPVQAAVMTFCFRLFGHYEQQQQWELAFFYCKKILCMITQMFLPKVGEILLERHPFFDYALQMVANSQIEHFMHRSVVIISAWMTRLGNNVVDGLDTQYRQRALMQSLHTCYKLCLFGILKMNHRYCYAWRIGIIHSYVLSCVSSQDFYRRSSAYRPNTPVMDFSPTHIDALVQEITHVTSPLPSSYAYWHLVSDVVKFSDDESRVYDPSKSPLVFEMPRGFDFDWFPESAVNFNHVMESLFDAGTVDASFMDFGGCD